MADFAIQVLHDVLDLPIDRHCAADSLLLGLRPACVGRSRATLHLALPLVIFVVGQDVALGHDRPPFALGAAPIAAHIESPLGGGHRRYREGTHRPLRRYYARLKHAGACENRQMRVVPRSLAVAFVVSSLAAVLAGCSPTATGNLQLTAQTIVDQLPNSSDKETPASWIAEFQRRGFTGTELGTIVDVSTRTWDRKTLANDRSIAYVILDSGGVVHMDLAMLATGTTAGVPGINDSSYTCARVKLSPVRKRP